MTSETHTPMGLLALQTVLNHNAFTKDGLLTYFDHLSFKEKMEIFKKINKKTIESENEKAEKFAEKLMKNAHTDWKLRIDKTGRSCEMKMNGNNIDIREWMFFVYIQNKSIYDMFKKILCVEINFIKNSKKFILYYFIQNLDTEDYPKKGYYDISFKKVLELLKLNKKEIFAGELKMNF